MFREGEDIKKLILDKYYTPFYLAQYCYDKTVEVLGKSNIVEIIEPSAGAGVFLDCDDSIIGYDIAPEDTRIIEQDFLSIDIGYKVGRLILGNPPYGRCLNLAQKFFKKATELGDYIAFILPISQLNTNYTFFEFDLIYSEDLGECVYSDRKLKCAFNIYKRPVTGVHTRKTPKLKGVKIYRQDRKNYTTLPYDLRIGYWGNGQAGKILDEFTTCAGEYKLCIIESEHKQEILDYLKNFDWTPYMTGIAMNKLNQCAILTVLAKQFPYLV